ncbi:3TM-type holin [Marinibactrum halimedae]|uniref:Holin of 3TMs, for gene-transfer release n=1 Tax=Marinibactrum halimedae TaxID=1444977 RepID=A0AA37T6D3_9GAMM|nr:3TM-type holin [Marinibactrum halimedae]MCD9458902.1 holin family protein [Marinibactrum halimedae]GLS27750.1 hypothetical protein GCM10007877_34690 [Marinibactrum halimedae]
MISEVAGLLTSAIDKFAISKADKAKLKHEAAKLAMEGRFKEQEMAIQAIVAEAKSSDPYTSRARPTFLYVMYGVIIFCFLGGILGIWWPDQTFQAAKNIEALLDSVPEGMWIMFGAGYLGYVKKRSDDKLLLSGNKVTKSGLL